MNPAIMLWGLVLLDIALPCALVGLCIAVERAAVNPRNRRSR